MKSPLWTLTGFVVLTAAILTTAAEKTDKANPWIADFQRYAAQKNLEMEQRFSSRPPAADSMTMSGLLRALPEPAEWPQLRRALAEAAATAPAGVERERLQAGGWLLAYLLGDRAAVLAELPAGESAPTSPVSHALNNLRTSLGNSERGEMPPEKQLEFFEQQLQAVEPVDLAEVVRVLGGEENFARLHRLLAAGKAMNEKAGQILEEYEKTKDEAAARARMEALEKDFVRENTADQQALESALNQPLIQRYVGSLYQETMPDNYTPDISVPDLVKLAGRERAEALLRRALHLPVKLSVSKESGEETRKLARELALGEVAALKVPSWSLTHEVEAGALFEALRKRFPDADPKDYHFQAAGGYYLVGLIQQGRTQEAVVFASRPEAGAQLNLPYEVMNTLEHGGRASELWEFLKGWLGKYPAATEWDRFNRLSVQLGRQAELKAMIKAMAASGAFAGMDRLRVQQMQADAELATDDLAAAGERLHALLQPPAANDDERRFQLDTAIKLLQLADLREDAAGFGTVLAAAEAGLEKSWLQKPAEAISGTASLTTTLNRLGRLAESARIGRAALERVPALKQKAAAQKEGDDERLDLPDYELRNLLGEQLRAAVELGRWPEALALVQESPWWNAKDATGLLHENLSSNRKPVGFYLAQVALHQGDQALARRILEAQLVVTPGVDAVYDAYLGLAKQDARPLLAKLAAADRYEERPLIWLAKLQSDAGEWDAATATLQQAINIDPSDGEQGQGDRMRVYAFMARAMKAKGDAVKAKFFEDVVKSIRLSETADRWYEIGAYAHAIALYRQALGFFQDAYCIQSRLAIRLADAGRMDEAAEHYRRAFELMPDSFGRVESHCFGCEHVFAGKKSQGVAEAVFARMLQARPDKPQLHYLSGYLHEEQERLPEAAENYRRAVQLDPLYLNAWNRLAGLEDKLKFSAAQRDDLLLKLVELDPARRHASPDLAKVADLPRLWRVLKKADEVLDDLPAPGSLWELKASAERLAQAKDDDTPSWDSSGRERKDFASVLLEHNFVQALQAYLASLNQPPEEESEEPASGAKTD